MKLLILSDSHSTLSFMRRCVEAVKPDGIVHLGDFFEDAGAIMEEYPGIPLYRVPGNCDRYRCPPGQPQILIQQFDGVTFYLTHGHKHNVKSYLGGLLRDARASRADVVLYGHTHVSDCHQEEDGLWVMNPGSCGYFGGSAGLIETRDGTIRLCRLLKDSNLLMP